MKYIAAFLAMSMLTAQHNSTDSVESRQPREKIPFNLSYYDIRKEINEQSPNGHINVQFEIDIYGNVVNPIILDSFNVTLNSVVLDKIKQAKYYPALQNGTPVKVRYTMPIKFK